MTQSSTSSSIQPEKLKTRDRILEAATQVFAEHGVKGATTREIAKAADVNETTLFRHFQNKDALFKAVVERSATEIAEAITGTGMSNNDLRKDFGFYAKTYSALLHKNEAMIRMLLGESRRQPEEASHMIYNVWQPVRERLTKYLDDAKAQGKVRSDVDSWQAIEILRGMLFSNMLRKSYCPDELAKVDFVEPILDIFIRGIETQKPEDV